MTLSMHLKQNCQTRFSTLLGKVATSWAASAQFPDYGRVTGHPDVESYHISRHGHSDLLQLPSSHAREDQRLIFICCGVRMNQ
jgi:hypothetical protein